jgi:hypothetical protein
MRRPTPKATLGFAIVLLSFVALDYVSGGVFRATSDDTNLQVTVFLQGTHAPDSRLSFRAKFSMRRLRNVQLQISAFDQVLDRGVRRALLNATNSMVIRLNFKPRSITLPGTGTELIASLKNCREHEYCLTLDRAQLQQSRGHLEIDTGVPLAKTSLSSAVAKLGVISGQPSTDVEAVVDLPDGWHPTAPMPDPTHVASFAWTKLTWRADPDRGISIPIKSERAIAQTIGVQLPIQNARLAQIETTLLFFLSAIFGVGFTLASDWLVSLSVARSRPTR